MAKVSAHVQARAIIVKRFGRFLIGDKERTRAESERREPTRIAVVQAKRRSPDRALIVQDIFEELLFERRCRRGLGRWTWRGLRLCVRACADEQQRGEESQTVQEINC